MVDENKLGGPAAPPPRRPFNRRQIAAQVIVAAVILASGIGIGAGGTILALKDRIARFPFPMDPRGPGGFDPNRPVELWRVELGLTDEQAAKIRDVLKDGVKAARERWLQIWQAEQTERQAFIKSMKSILAPEQFAKWQDEYTQRAQHFDRWRRGGPGRGGGSEGPGGPDMRRGMRGGRRGPDFDPNRPPDVRRNRPRDFDPNRPPESTRQPPREFGPDRPPEPGREPPPEFAPGQPPEPNQRP
jgi:Spy/CpxP family protein refolding chaperone